MEEEQPPTSELEALLGRMRLPSIPDDAFDKDNADLAQIRSWRKLYVASIFSGLLTDKRIATFDNDGTLWVEQPMYV